MLASDLFEARTLTGARLYVFAVIEHATRRMRILGVTAHPTVELIVPPGRNLVMDLEDANSRAGFLIRDQDSKFPQAFDAVLADADMKVVTSGIRMPRMNSVMERWIQTCRRELLDHTLVWNQSHLLHALREFSDGYGRVGRRQPSHRGDDKEEQQSCEAELTPSLGSSPAPKTKAQLIVPGLCPVASGWWRARGLGKVSRALSRFLG